METIMQKLAGDIAAHLTGSWRAQPNDEDGNWRAYILGANGEKLFLSNTWGGKGRIFISGSFPNGHSHTDSSITVAETKTPSQVAKDIERRLLPSYQVALAAEKEKAEKDYRLAFHCGPHWTTRQSIRRGRHHSRVVPRPR